MEDYQVLRGSNVYPVRTGFAQKFDFADGLELLVVTDSVHGDFQSAHLTSRDGNMMEQAHVYIERGKPEFRQGAKSQRELADYLEAVYRMGIKQLTNYLRKHPNISVMSPDLIEILQNIKQTTFEYAGGNIISELRAESVPKWQTKK